MVSLRTHHVGITVSDLERAVDFYGDVLGLSVESRFSVSGDAFATGVGVDGASARFAHLEAGGALVELVEYEPAGTARSSATINQPGSTHLGFLVDDIARFYADLPESLETISEPQTTESGSTILFFTDPDGTLIEVLER
ncbi:VOC family protein [Natronobiforma cellulositropha]|uniref:VOC family protein n=1 Tax=Natronobiforma cellulositropha TaxID=1679076 RepID=UPI0021D61287|nr:VOC family protein [Natronobiforma cellulositropha]